MSWWTPKKQYRCQSDSKELIEVIFRRSLPSISIHYIFVIFLHGQIFGLSFSPHGMCVNRDKIGVATKQRKLLLNRFCNKTAQIPTMPRQNSVNNNIFYSLHLKFLQIQNFSTSKIFPHLRYPRNISPHLKFLHMTQNFLHGHCPRQICSMQSVSQPSPVQKALPHVWSEKLPQSYENQPNGSHWQQHGKGLRIQLIKDGF